MNKFILFILIIFIISILLKIKNTNTLLVTIIIIIIFIFYYHNNTNTDSDTDIKNIEKDTEIISKTTNNYRVKENKKDLKYLNKELLTIIQNIRFVKRYDKSRYIDLLNLANVFQKTYIFIMSDRWDIVQYLPILKDLRKDILELLYSIYIIIPVKTKNTFGFEPYKKLDETIENFNQYSIQKLEIVKKYGSDYKGIVHMLETRIDSYNEREKFLLP